MEHQKRNRYFFFLRKKDCQQRTPHLHSLFCAACKASDSETLCRWWMRSPKCKYTSLFYTSKVWFQADLSDSVILCIETWVFFLGKFDKSFASCLILIFLEIEPSIHKLSRGRPQLSKEGGTTHQQLKILSGNAQCSFWCWN